MVQWVRYSLIVAASAVLLSCASTTMTHQYMGGKYDFKNGDYKQAFRKLLPVAVNGRPEAQYAVGYMYYYGYGVSQDSESGTFWMERAAQKNYPPAIEALSLIHNNAEKPPRPKESDERTMRHQITYPNKQPAHDDVLSSLPQQPVKAKRVSLNTPDGDDGLVAVSLQHSPENNVVPAPEPEAKITVAETKPVEVKPEIKPVTEEKPAPVQLAKTDFTLQLFGAYQLSAVKNVQSQLDLRHTSHIWHTKHNGKDWYVLTYGNFATAHEAIHDKKVLPAELKDFAPWVRNVDGLERV